MLGCSRFTVIIRWHRMLIKLYIVNTYTKSARSYSKIWESSKIYFDFAMGKLRSFKRMTC